MDDLTRLPHQLNEKQSQCRAIIETPRGSRSKLSYDPQTKLFHMKRVLPKGMSFPFHFGFIPKTKGEDGDPLDVLVLLDELCYPGCHIECRVLGVIEAEQTEKKETVRNDRIIATAVESARYAKIDSLKDLDKYLVDEII